MDFEWNKYKLTTKMTFDSPIEYIFILPDKEKILITYKSSINIYNIKTLQEEGKITLKNIEKIENLYLLKRGLISICTKNSILLIELNKDNTYKIFQTIELTDIEENKEFVYLIELKNSNLCILSKYKIFIYKLENNFYKIDFSLVEDFCFQYGNEKGENISCIELIYPEKNIENKIATYLHNVSCLSFWDLNERKKINNTKDNYCNTYDLKDIFCLMEKGKYLLCACIDEAIEFYSSETCKLIKILYDIYWHISVLKLNENQILSGGDFGTITFYEFNYEHEFFKKEGVGLTREETEKVEKKIDVEIPEIFKEKTEKYAHGKAINEIRRFGNIIISSSCYEDNDYSFVCFWNKK